MKINGETHYLWRAVDHEGEVLESYVTRRRDRRSALKFLRKSMKRFGNPKIIVTDKLRSYGAAMKVIGNADRQDTGRWLNNRAENSHLPFRRRERAMLRFRQMRSLQKFASVHASVHNHFNHEPHRRSRRVASAWRGIKRCRHWQAETGSHSSDTTKLGARHLSKSLFQPRKARCRAGVSKGAMASRQICPAKVSGKTEDTPRGR